MTENPRVVGRHVPGTFHLGSEGFPERTFEFELRSCVGREVSQTEEGGGGSFRRERLGCDGGCKQDGVAQILSTAGQK